MERKKKDYRCPWRAIGLHLYKPIVSQKDSKWRMFPIHIINTKVCLRVLYRSWVVSPSDVLSEEVLWFMTTASYMRRSSHESPTQEIKFQTWVWLCIILTHSKGKTKPLKSSHKLETICTPQRGCYFKSENKRLETKSLLVSPRAQG